MPYNDQKKSTNLYSIMYSIGPIYCRALGSQTFNVYIDKVGVSSHFGRCHKWVKSRSVCVSFRAYTRRRLWSDRDHIWHTHANSTPNGSELNKNQPRVGGFTGSAIQKSGITTKRMDQLAPNLAHMGGFVWEWT